MPLPLWVRMIRIPQMTWRRCYGIRLETDHLFSSSFFDWSALRNCLDASLRPLPTIRTESTPAPAVGGYRRPQSDEEFKTGSFPTDPSSRSRSRRDHANQDNPAQSADRKHYFV